MAETTGISARVADELGALGLLTTEQLAWVRSQAEATGESAGRLALERQFVSEADVARVLEDSLGTPRVDLASYAPDAEAIAQVPETLARASAVVPLFEIDGVLTVAIGRASSVFDLDALGAGLGFEIEVVLADPDAVVSALAQCYGLPADAPAPTPIEEGAVEDAQAPDHEAAREVGGGSRRDDAAAELEMEPALSEPVPDPSGGIDLDVLAVADSRRAAMLAVEILETAVRSRAAAIHVLPDKDGFVLALNIDGHAEELGRAPLSLEGALVEALKGLVRMPLAATAPSVSQLQTEIAGVAVTLVASLVTTLAGPRLVVTLAYESEPVPALHEAGLPARQVKGIASLLENGSGVLVVAAPVGEGLRSTYRMLLAHAAGTERAVYSVETGVGPRVAGVAQVLALPGAVPGAEACLAAGLLQDTDVIGLDVVRSAEEAHLAMEAARGGKLVVLGVTAAGAVSAIRRLIDMGVDPVSLSASLNLVVARRTARGRSGSEKALFEVLQATDEVRAATAADGDAKSLTDAAVRAGMRPFSALLTAEKDEVADAPSAEGPDAVTTPGAGVDASAGGSVEAMASAGSATAPADADVAYTAYVDAGAMAEATPHVDAASVDEFEALMKAAG